MPERTLHTATAQNQGGGAASTWDAALAAIYKALKAFSFYPAGHPLRERILQDAYQVLVQAAAVEPLSLTVRRNGFSAPQQKAPFSPSPVANGLAHELFSREIQRFAVLPELPRTQFIDFLSLLSLDPARLSAGGGLIALLKQRGVDAIILDEIDISAVFTRRNAEQTVEEGAQGTGTDAGAGEDQDAPPDAAGLLDQQSEISAAELILLMSMEKDDSQYRQLARQLLAKGMPLKQDRDFDRLFPILFAMAEQGLDLARSAACRNQAVGVLHHLLVGEPAEHLLDHLEDAEFTQKENVYLVLKGAGAEVVDTVIKRLIAVGLKASRKAITTAILRIGHAAEPALLGLLKDGRWPVVLASIAILADMGTRDAVKELVLTAYHPDNRVRMESIRALATIGGMEASAALFELMQDQNQAIAAHAITWLGNSRNQRALQPLLHLVLSRDLLGRHQALKRDALIAIGKIGDRRALDSLFRLVLQRYWIAPRRREALKPLTLETIGVLGGESARDFLKSVEASGGYLSRHASLALEALAKRHAEDHE